MKLRTRLVASAIAAVAVVASLAGCAEAVDYDGPASNCLVTGKDRVQGSSSGDSEMRVYTSNCGTFEVGDLPFHHEYNSADVYGAILPGHRYTFKAYGWRNGYTSSFPIIARATEVAQ